jgi:hypothetical protein
MERAQRPGAQLRRIDRLGKQLSRSCFQNSNDLVVAQRRRLECGVRRGVAQPSRHDRFTIDNPRFLWPKAGSLVEL